MKCQTPSSYMNCRGMHYNNRNSRWFRVAPCTRSSRFRMSSKMMVYDSTAAVSLQSVTNCRYSVINCRIVDLGTFLENLGHRSPVRSLGPAFLVCRGEAKEGPKFWPGEGQGASATQQSHVKTPQLASSGGFIACGPCPYCMPSPKKKITAGRRYTSLADFVIMS